MLENQLRKLASRPESKHPFLTLYIDTNRSDESQRDRLRLFLKNETQKLRDALHDDGIDSVERGLKQIESYLENELDASTRGVAIFACPQDDVFEPLQLPIPVRQELAVGTRPRLRQLTELWKSFPRVAVVMVDGKYARLFMLQFGRILQEIDLADTSVPRKHDQGGLSQPNMQRHVQEHVDRHHKDVAETLTKMVDDDGARSVIISGQERNIANFRTFLSKRVEERIIGTLHLDIRTPADEVADAAQKVVVARQTSELSTRLADLEDVAKKNGRGALGTIQVIDASNQRKIESLFVSPGARVPGWKCSACQTVGESIPLGCPACGEPIVSIELIEEFIAAAHRDGGSVDFVPEPSMLDQYDGVGAILRF